MPMLAVVNISWPSIVERRAELLLDALGHDAGVARRA